MTCPFATGSVFGLGGKSKSIATAAPSSKQGRMQKEGKGKGQERKKEQKEKGDAVVVVEVEVELELVFLSSCTLLLLLLLLLLLPQAWVLVIVDLTSRCALATYNLQAPGPRPQANAENGKPRRQRGDVTVHRKRAAIASFSSTTLHNVIINKPSVLVLWGKRRLADVIGARGRSRRSPVEHPVTDFLSRFTNIHCQIDSQYAGFSKRRSIISGKRLELGLSIACCPTPSCLPSWERVHCSTLF